MKCSDGNSEKSLQFLLHTLHPWPGISMGSFRRGFMFKCTHTWRGRRGNFQGKGHEEHIFHPNSPGQPLAVISVQGSREQTGTSTGPFPQAQPESPSLAFGRMGIHGTGRKNSNIHVNSIPSWKIVRFAPILLLFSINNFSQPLFFCEFRI